jgi:hypothetical protein
MPAQVRRRREIALVAKDDWVKKRLGEKTLG